MRRVTVYCPKCDRETTVVVDPDMPDEGCVECIGCKHVFDVRVRPTDDIGKLAAMSAAGYHVLFQYIEGQIRAVLSRSDWPNGTLLPVDWGDSFTSVLRQCYEHAMKER